MKRSFDDYPALLEVEADVAVLGAGAGGCAMALALAERGLKVAVFEEGRHWEHTQFKSSNTWALRHLYQERGARVAIGDGWLPINGGKGVGGSTLINSAISFRTPEPVVARWRETCGFDPEGSYLQHLERVWSTLEVGPNPEGVQGRNNTLFLEGARKLGWESGFLDRSAPRCAGCGVCQLGCPSGGKNSADRVWLRRALEHDCVAYADCRVEDLEREGDRIVAATGSLIEPQGEQPAGRFRVKARHFVLSAGPIGSPRLLMRTGLAPNDHVGQHLSMHPASGVFGIFDEEVVNWDGVAQGAWVNRWEEGYLLETGNGTPDVHFLSLPLHLGRPINEVMAQLRHVAIAGAMVHDEDSVASVSESALFISFGELDRERLLRGIRATAELWLAAGAHTVYTSINGGEAIHRAADIAAAVPMDTPFAKIQALASHPMGTCRMGLDPADSVVDPTGKVWGLDNLHIADASVFPSSLGVNPQVTVMAVALMIGAGIG